MLNTVIAFFLILVPCMVWNGIGDGIRTPKEILSIIGFISIIGVSLSHYTKKSFSARWLFLFWGWCFVTTIFNVHDIPVFLPKDIVVNTPVLMFAWKHLFYITLATLTIYCLAAYDEPRYQNLKTSHFSVIFRENLNVASAINFVVITLGCYAIIQALGLDNFFRVTNNHGLVAQTNTGGYWHFHHRVVATIGNPSILSIWVAICLPICLSLKKKIGYLGLILGIVTIIMTKSTTGYIAGAGGLLFYLLCKSWKKFTVVMLLLIALSPFAIQKIDYKEFIDPTGRIECHKEAWNILQHRPLLGMGLGTFRYMIGLNPDIVEKLADENWHSLHNDIGQVWWDVGLIGFALFILFLGSVFIRFKLNMIPEAIPIAAGLFAFLITCLTTFPMRLSPHSFYGVIFTGLLLRKTRRLE